MKRVLGELETINCHPESMSFAEMCTLINIKLSLDDDQSSSELWMKKIEVFKVSIQVLILVSIRRLFRNVVSDSSPSNQVLEGS